MKNYLLLLFCLTCSIFSFAQTSRISGKVLKGQGKEGLAGVSIFVANSEQTYSTNSRGIFLLDELPAGKYEMIFFKEEYQTFTQVVKVAAGETISLNIELEPLTYQLKAVEIEAQLREKYGLRRLRNVEGYAIYAAKKSEVINLENMVANLATNNSRQVYKGIAGLNIWESDGAGLQLGIGARGLDPNRTSNFNTRQNGYDISADALGYPESYYTPPTQALKKN